ncbi:MAG: S8 family serine peptidase, partial [Desulfuromonadales bacterium]|nr:S8 family serine peptidase [Desulfuromonadales bacterium]
MSVSIRIVSAGCFLLISSLLSFSAALAQPDFWYDGRRKVPLVTEAQSDGSQGPTQYQSSRSVHRDVARRNDGRLYVCYPPTWSDGQIASLEQRYQLLPTQQPLPDDARVRLYQHAKIFDTTSLANRIFEENDLDCAAPLWQKRVSLKTVVPNDPLFSQQWYLENFGQCGAGAGEDISASAAWELSLGEDITLAIVDSGIDLQHPDLVGNLLFGGHRDFIPDGSAIGPHGTAVAGLAAAKGFNNRGLIGVAPETSMLSFRIISGEELFADEADEAAALNSWRVDVDIYNNSWGPPDDDLASFEGPSMLVRDAIESGVRQGRGGLGSIYLWAAGNGGPTQSSTLDGYANLRHAISVTATTCTGRAASYAELGSNILVNAPAGDGAFGLVTTDEVGSFGYNAGLGFGDLSDPDYTDTFIGTSAATPVVSGVVALMLEANPQLNWREVQQILALSAEQNHPV